MDDSIFVNPRICYFAAAGNYRWAGYPATSSNVLCAGGASLFYDSTNLQVNVWGNTTAPSSINALSGGGTGFSNSTIGESYARPVHQNGLTALAAVTSNRRACPDICSLGDPVTGVLIIFASLDGTKLAQQQIGGTSLASPLLCGLFSHLSQLRINRSEQPLTTRLTDVGSSALAGSVNLQAFVYNNFKQSSAVASAMFYDIVTGSTRLPTDANLGLDNSDKTFAAASGYDIATGLGFPLLPGIMNRMYPIQSEQPAPPVSVGAPNVTGQQNPSLTTPKVVFNFNLTA
jgi:subtilase family serine protease